MITQCKVVGVYKLRNGRVSIDFEISRTKVLSDTLRDGLATPVVGSYVGVSGQGRIVSVTS